jgi:hypothetical protein
MDDPTTYRERRQVERVVPVSSVRPTTRPAARSRWTGFTGGLPENSEQREAPLNTLEQLIEAEDEAADRDAVEEGSDEN